MTLVGLPACGKSTIGRRLATLLDTEFHDSDGVLEQSQGCSISEIFAREGEERFRHLEQEVIERLTRCSTGVLATGGGSVLRESNRLALAQRSVCIYLHCAPTQLVRRIRPAGRRPMFVTADPAAKLLQLYEERDSHYRSVARCVVEVGWGTAAEAAKRIAVDIRTQGLGLVESTSRKASS